MMAPGESGSRSGPRRADAGAERTDDSCRVLKAKYRDYCSARVADVLLTLSPDEIYVIAEAEARKARVPGTPGSYTEAVDLATRKVREQLQLPDFGVWAEEYERTPERFESYLLGLWESEEESPRDA